MNERVMQFRIGMFVIVAGLVLTMLIVWFGESPSLFRDHAYLTVHFDEAPGVAEGIPVRKSGIRIGEVAAVQFDDRENKGDGVLVTLSLDKKYKLKAGSTPKISRALIGDVSIDMTPGTGSTPLKTSMTPNRPRDEDIVEGLVSPDPSKAIEAASRVIGSVQGTLGSIDAAAQGLAKLSKKAENLDEFIASIRDAGKKVGRLADDLDLVVKENAGNIKPALDDIRQVAGKLNNTLDEPTVQRVKESMTRIASASAKLDALLADISPLAKDLGADANSKPRTAFGWTVNRIYGISRDVSLLTKALNDGQGGLSKGSLQLLLTSTALHDNLDGTITAARRALASINKFADRVSNNPSELTRGVLNR